MVRMNGDWRPPFMPTPRERAVSNRSSSDAVGMLVELERQPSHQDDGGRTEDREPEPLDVGRPGIVAELIDHRIGPRLDLELRGRGVVVGPVRAGGQVGREHVVQGPTLIAGLDG